MRWCRNLQHLIAALVHVTCSKKEKPCLKKPFHYHYQRGGGMGVGIFSSIPPNFLIFHLESCKKIFLFKYCFKFVLCPPVAGKAKALLLTCLNRPSQIKMGKPVILLTGQRLEYIFPVPVTVPNNRGMAGWPKSTCTATYMKQRLQSV